MIYLIELILDWAKRRADARSRSLELNGMYNLLYLRAQRMCSEKKIFLSEFASYKTRAKQNLKYGDLEGMEDLLNRLYVVDRYGF